MSALKKLPPNVARELLRHVNPPASATAQQTTQQQASGAGKHRGVVIGCLAFTAAAACIPVFTYYWMGGLTQKEDGLTAAQNRRGAFLNSGSKDIGVDPSWDFTKGQYKEDTGYAAMPEGEGFKPKGEFLAMSESDLKKHEDKLEAFAKGRGRSNG